MKKLLLSSGPYGGLDDIEFPVKVECLEFYLGNIVLWDITAEELIRVGANERCLTVGNTYPFKQSEIGDIV